MPSYANPLLIGFALSDIFTSKLKYHHFLSFDGGGGGGVGFFTLIGGGGFLPSAPIICFKNGSVLLDIIDLINYKNIQTQIFFGEDGGGGGGAGRVWLDVGGGFTPSFNGTV
ncbi:hypothetical protein [Serratia sp. NPDC087055]|uniref:hypothetical protein n=1 Tax=Serratia sp. NPDC087055 TaxID=3364516 RepID=UPI00384D7518